MERKPWSEMKEREINKLKSEQCVKCRHFTFGAKSRMKNGALANLTCNYITDVGHKRGCDPRDCIAKGIFNPIEKKRRKRIVL